MAEQALASVRSGGTLDPLGWVVWHVIRAQADAAELSGGPGPASGSTGGRPALMELGIGGSSADLPGIRARRSPRCAAPSSDRYRGARDPAAWAAVADLWSVSTDPSSSPTPATVRARHSSRRVARGDAAADALAPRSTAAALGAAPLVRDITVLAGHARIALEDEDTTEGATSAVRDPAAALGLTAREAEVIRMLAIGRTNQEIADELFLSRKTASVHVSNIAQQLGVSNRVQAAAVAQRVGLVADDAGDVREGGLTGGSRATLTAFLCGRSCEAGVPVP